MKRSCIVLAAAFAAAFTIPAETVKTASQPWVTNYVAQATNAISRETAPAEIPYTFTDGTNAQLRVVRSNSQLVIRACETANGQRQYRLVEIR